MISVEDALTRCLALCTPLPAETVPLAEAAGRWMCAPAVATRDQPPFAASAMDGYAVQGNPGPDDNFLVIGEAGAGHAFEGNSQAHGEFSRRQEFTWLHAAVGQSAFDGAPVRVY